MQVVFLGTLDTWIRSVPFQSIRGALLITFDDSCRKILPSSGGEEPFSPAILWASVHWLVTISTTLLADIAKTIKANRQELS
jgi:hypothetical protein